MRTIKVDGQEVEVDSDLTLLQACEEAGKEIPRFCYHERLSVAGNCRMCLIEVKGGPPKPVASCAQNVKDLRPGPEGQPPELFTNTKMVKEAREGVMEFLLINHPLDCPICDQGGECDLQDQAMAYGTDGSRYAENKRAVEDKYIGPLVKTIMTRCIHCTRCIRFATEVAGVPELGAIGRGEDMEITTYLEEAMSSELQGNVIDLCPVGALTSRPYAFQARPWELKKTETIDVMDALGSNIRVDSRGKAVMRIIPRNADDINEEWISDKTRFVWDGLGRQRLDQPYVRRDGKLQPATWNEAFAAIAEKMDGLDGTQFAALAGDMACAESMKALKDLAMAVGSTSIDCRQDGTKLEAGARGGYIFNSGIAGIDEADAILLIGSNPRTEAPVLNARIRRRWRETGLPVANIGQPFDLTYPVTQLGAGPDTLNEVVSGTHGIHSFAQVLQDAKRPMIIVGQGALTRADGAAVLAAAISLAGSVGALSDEWNGFNVLHTAAARVAGLDLGFVPGESGRDTTAILDAARSGDVKVVYLLGADEIDGTQYGDAFVIYQGSHGDRGAHRADVILPGAAYTEKSATWVNTEGRAQLGRRATFPPGDAREDWSILRALSDVLGKTLPYDNLADLRAAMYEDAPHLMRIGQVEAGDVPRPAAGNMDSAPFEPAIADFFLSNPIARASKTMADLSLAATHRVAATDEGTGTHG
ncbi:NADH-quinone oxidoreductase subunit NuoG [Pyruvatibacter sp.]|uniref:NADH-quinone oxidoreductase subunit NuoG n=1 Tax=Pyruvatibacter sp. TaxID=1981328 RepID=UPI0032EF95A5